MKQHNQAIYSLVAAAIFVMVALLNSSCTPVKCMFKGKIQPSKNVKHQRMILRKKYKYHQTKIGRLINFNKL